MIKRCSAVAAGGIGAAVWMHLLAAVVDPGPLNGVMRLQELPSWLYPAAAAGNFFRDRGEIPGKRGFRKIKIQA